MGIFIILGICVILGVVGVVSTKYMGPDNEIEKETEQLIETELGAVSKLPFTVPGEKPKPKQN